MNNSFLQRTAFSTTSVQPNTSRSTTLSPTEITLEASDGMRLAAQVWKSPSSTDTNSSISSTSIPPTKRRRILALHGWMDNAASFHLLAPRIVQAFPNTELVALDLIGHGRSSHKSRDGPPVVLAEAVYYVAEAIEQLQWYSDQDSEVGEQEQQLKRTTPFTLIGHSMGAAISCLYSAAFPEQIQSLVLLDGVGPLARDPRDVAKHVRGHVQRRLRGVVSKNSRLGTSPNATTTTTTAAVRMYPSLEAAVRARCQTARNFPGNQSLSKEAAEQLVRRGSASASATSSETVEGIFFTHDPRLTWPSLQYFTVEQTEAVYRDIQCPTCLLLAQDGWGPALFVSPTTQARVVEELLQPIVVKTLKGSHHFHADPNDAEEVLREVIEFLNIYA